MNTFLNFETYIPLTDFETVTNIKCEDRREISSLTNPRTHRAYPKQQLKTEVPDVPEKRCLIDICSGTPCRVYLELVVSLPQLPTSAMIL